MNIMKFFVIIMFVGITGTLPAMDFSKALQAGRPLTHADIIHTMLENKAFSPQFPAVDCNGKIYTLTDSSHYTHDYIESFHYKLERPMSSSEILNYKTDIVRFLHFVRINDTANDKIKRLSDPENIKDYFTETYKINYRNIAKAGGLLALGTALFMLTQS